MKTIVSIIFSILQIICSDKAYAGEYTQDGYITELKANVQGNGCNIMIGSKDGVGFQGGSWSCNSIVGQNMFNAAQMAKLYRLKVSVVLEGNGGTYKPVYSILVHYN